MKNIVVASSEFKHLIEMVVEDLEVDYPILWVDSNKSDSPAKLYQMLQWQVGCIDNVDNIILVFKNWGIHLRELRSDKARLVFPKIENWNSLIQAGEIRNRVTCNTNLPFQLVRRELNKETNLWVEFTYCLNKWGAERTKKIFADFLKEHHRLWGINTGTVEKDDGYQSAKQNICDIIQIINGPLSIMYKAFRGEWDDRIIQVMPGEPCAQSLIFHHPKLAQ